MKYKIICLLILWMSAQLLSAQETEISGVVNTEENQALAGATIQTERAAGAVTDEAGRFSLQVKGAEETYRLRIQRIGYETVDTTVRTSANKIYLSITMKAKIYEQAPVEITASGFNAFDYTEWKILDFHIYQNKLLILSLLNRKRTIGLYTLAGLKITERELADKYNQIFLSCTNGVHLLGRDSCYELQIATEEILPIRKYDRKLFEQLLEPCLLEVGTELVFKKLSRHNKKAQYYKFLQAKQTKLIAEVYDEQRAAVAQSYYNEIIALYYKSVNYQKASAIDAGLGRVNIIANGEWGGDLMDLMFTTELHFAIAYYLNIEAQPIRLLEFEHYGFFYLLDLSHRKMFRIDVATLQKEELSLEGFNWKKKAKIIIDEKTNLVYLLDNKSELYLMKFKKQACELVKQAKPDWKTPFPQDIRIHDHQLYYFYPPDVGNRKSKLHTQSLR